MVISAYVFAYSLTGDLFYESGIDSGGRRYLSTRNDRHRRVPFIFEEKHHRGGIIFEIPEDDVPEEDRGVYGGSFKFDRGVVPFEFPEDREFIREYIRFVPVSIRIKS